MRAPELELEALLAYHVEGQRQLERHWPRLSLRQVLAAFCYDCNTVNSLFQPPPSIWRRLHFTMRLPTVLAGLLVVAVTSAVAVPQFSTHRFEGRATDNDGLHVKRDPGTISMIHKPFIAPALKAAQDTQIRQAMGLVKARSLRERELEARRR
ncbi:hypothetical protein EIP91_007251 [Steccherinum ochraceum]|uniref:Uncharacterized protein n=1 Tax=Steccherinum ochraceum TaxID=92696 RepID=A0A4R0R734_9APHY|nr:hypothetical protein EIP91_007251 [Steccherinum ochraceum]